MIIRHDDRAAPSGVVVGAVITGVSWRPINLCFAGIGLHSGARTDSYDRDSEGTEGAALAELRHPTSITVSPDAEFSAASQDTGSNFSERDSRTPIHDRCALWRNNGMAPLFGDSALTSKLFGLSG